MRLYLEPSEQEPPRLTLIWRANLRVRGEQLYRMVEIVEEGRAEIRGLRCVVLKRLQVLVLGRTKKSYLQPRTILRALARTSSAATAAISPRL